VCVSVAARTITAPAVSGESLRHDLSTFCSIFLTRIASVPVVKFWPASAIRRAGFFPHLQHSSFTSPLEDCRRGESGACLQRAKQGASLADRQMTWAGHKTLFLTRSSRRWR
jgi:hypothetical protein